MTHPPLLRLPGPTRLQHVARLSLGLLLAMAWPALARSGSDEQPIPFSDAPTVSPGTLPAAEAPSPLDKDLNQSYRKRSYGASDDPAVGLGAELVGGLMLLDSSRGALAQPLLTAGGRVTWDYGRLLAEPTLHEGLFLDATFLWTHFATGTQSLRVDATYETLTLAPAFELPFSEGSAWGVYVQAGGGATRALTTVTSQSIQTASAYQPVVQYGLGLRGRPLLSEDGRLRLTIRLEATRFRRAYLDDTLVLASAGLAF